MISYGEIISAQPEMLPDMANDENFVNWRAF